MTGPTIVEFRAIALEIPHPNHDGLMDRISNFRGFSRLKPLETEEQYVEAGQTLVAARLLAKEIEQRRIDTVAPLNDTKTHLQEAFKQRSDVLKRVADAYDVEMKAYRARLKAKAEQEERERQAAARAESERIAREARELEEAQRRREVELAKESVGADPQHAAEIARSIEIDRAETDAETERLEELARLTSYAAPAAPVAAPKIAGLSTTVYWKARVTDARLVPREYCTPDLQMLGGLARATKAPTTIPGVEFYPDESSSARER